MDMPGLHLTRIGKDEFLLEPSRSLNIRDPDRLLECIAGRLLDARAVRLYYDLSGQAIIDQVYYTWLNKLARIVSTINVRMICIHMRPIAAFALVQFAIERPVFETALDISGWQNSQSHAAEN